MTQETPAPTAPAIDWAKIGSPACDTGAQTELQKALGLLDANGKPILGADGKPVKPDFSRIVDVIPQLWAEGANGSYGWDPRIDIATGTVQNGRYVLTANTPDAHFNTPEVMAVITAVAKQAHATGLRMDSIKIQDVTEDARRILNKITGVEAPSCSVGSTSRR